MKPTLGAIAAACIIGLSGSWVWVVPGSLLMLLIIYENAVPASQRPGYGALLRKALPVSARPLLDQVSGSVNNAKTIVTSPWREPTPPAQAARTIAPPAPVAAPPVPVTGAPNYAAHAASKPSLDWLREINDIPNINPHVAVIGPTGSGKSTLVLAALSRRPGQLVITTIKSAQDDPWGGFPAVRLGFKDGEPDYSDIANAWNAVYREMNARHADGNRPRTPINLVADELTSCLDELSAQQFHRKFIRMWLSGRSVGIRLIVLDPTFNVRGWGIEGRGDVRESLLGVRCNRDKSALFFEWDAAKNQPFNKRPFDTSQVPKLAAAGLSPARCWRPDAPPADDLLSSLLTAPMVEPSPAAKLGEIRRLMSAGIGRTAAIRAVIPEATSSAVYQRWTRLLDDVSG